MPHIKLYLSSQNKFHLFSTELNAILSSINTAISHVKKNNKSFMQPNMSKPMGKWNRHTIWVYITHGSITAPSWSVSSLDEYLNLQSTDNTHNGFDDIIFYT
jgi:hypothetical protein